MPGMSTRKTDITEADFWRHIRARDSDASSAAPLRRAIELGRAGQRAKAYTALADWLAAQSPVFLETRMQRARQARRLTARQIATMTRTPLAQLVEADGSLDLDAQGDIRRVDMLARHTLAHDDGRARHWLHDALRTIHTHRHQFIMHRYPFGGQLGAYSHFESMYTLLYALLRTGGADADAVEAAMKYCMELGRIIRSRSGSHIVHNIFTAGVYGLLFLARTLDFFSEADEWDRQAIDMLDQDFDRSFYRDGGHLERNWGYGAHTIRRLTEVWQFAAATGGMHGREQHFTDGLRRAYQFYAYTLGPGDLSPGFGDEGLGDLGYIFDRALDSGLFPPDTPRDLGVDRSRSYLMDGAGVAIMRNGAHDDAAYCDITFGEYAGWHSHMDLLSMDFRAHGELLLQEVPRFGPYEHPMDLLWRAAEAHNLLLVDGFYYDARPIVGEDVTWHSDERLDFFTATHRAYRRVPDNEHRNYLMSGDLTVRRTIVFVKDPGYAVVLDSVKPDEGEHFNRSTSQLWHSPHGFRVIEPGVARTKGKVGCILACAHREPIRRMELGVDFSRDEVTKFHQPPHEQWHRLRINAWQEQAYTGCMGFATLLYPFRGKMPSVEIKALKLTGGVKYRAEAIAVTTPAGRDVLVLNPERLSGLTLRGKPVEGRAWIRLRRQRDAVMVE